MQYTNYTNLDSRYARPYEPGDRLVRGWTDEISAESFLGATELVLEHLFAKHNRDDRPDGQLCPSMSIGDVIVIGEAAWSITFCGFVAVQVDSADLITDRTWREVAP
jgi:hypothetical protein